jgi:hypothetical protein
MVNAHDRNGKRGQMPRSAQHRAIAAHDDRKVCALTNFGKICARVFCDTRMASRFGFDQDLAARLSQQSGEGAQRGV